MSYYIILVQLVNIRIGPWARSHILVLNGRGSLLLLPRGGDLDRAQRGGRLLKDGE